MVKTIPYLICAHSLTREGVSVAGIRDSLTAIGMNSATFDEYANQHWYIGRLLTQISQITHDNLWVQEYWRRPTAIECPLSFAVIYDR